MSITSFSGVPFVNTITLPPSSLPSVPNAQELASIFGIAEEDPTKFTLHPSTFEEMVRIPHATSGGRDDTRTLILFLVPGGGVGEPSVQSNLAHRFGELCLPRLLPFSLPLPSATVSGPVVSHHSSLVLTGSVRSIPPSFPRPRS